MDAKTLIKLQKDKAHRFLQEADDMLQQQRWDLAANRARMIQLRIKADYNSIAEVSEMEVREMAPLSREFVDNIEKLLS